MSPRDLVYVGTSGTPPAKNGPRRIDAAALVIEYNEAH